MRQTSRAIATVALLGGIVVLAAMAGLALTFWVSIRRRNTLAVPLGDPWDGRTLEWSIASPTPEYNFARIPTVEAEDDRRDRLNKALGRLRQRKAKVGSGPTGPDPMNVGPSSSG